MNEFKENLQKVIKQAIRSFYNFPGSIFSAIIVAIIAFIRIGMTYDLAQSYRLLFDSIQLAFVFGAALAMTLVGLKQTQVMKTSKNNSNLIGLLGGLVAFLLLYFFGGASNEQGIKYLTDISIARISAGIFINILMYMYTISKHKNINSFQNAFFIGHKAFIISAIYGFVLMVGVSGVLGAFQNLVYREMSNDLYQYVGVIIAFLTFTIFLGYFPIFDEKESKEDLEKELQPRFIIVLLDYILVPIIIALTIVLFIWSARVLTKGVDVSFDQLSAIATSYVLVGIWLHIMVANHDSGIANFYKKAYPFSAILILLFEARALVVQLLESSLKTTEYSFILLWVFAAGSVFFLILFKERPYRKIALLASIVSLIAVLPYIGYHKLPLQIQINRLEAILIEEEILVNNEIVKTDQDLDKEEKVNITDAVDFISYNREGEKPEWFIKDLNNETVFNNTFGFKKTYDYEDYPGSAKYYSTNVVLATQVIDISDYKLSVSIGNAKDKSSTYFEKDGENYEMTWDSMEKGIPKIVVKNDDRIIIEENLEGFLKKIEKEYPPTDFRDVDAPIEDMSLEIVKEEIELLLIFNSITIYSDSKEDRKDYYLDLNSIFIK